MPYADLKRSLEDVAFTTPAPFSEDGQDVRYDKLAEHASWLTQQGASVLIPCGNTGEYYSLTNQERKAIVERTVGTVGDDVTVVGGAGGSLAHVKKLVSDYEAVGADAVMIMDPSHTYIHQQGLIEYYKEIARATDLGVVLYKRSDLLTLDALSKITTLENVVAVKFAVNDINEFAKTADELSDDVVLSTGIAERFTPSFTLEGATGYTTGIGAFTPKTALDLMEALESKNWDRAKKIRDVVRPYEELREEPGPNNTHTAANNVPAIKYGMELAGLYGGPVRLPLIDLDEDDKDRAKRIYEQITRLNAEPKP